MTAGREEKHGVIRSCFTFLGVLFTRVHALGGDCVSNTILVCEMAVNCVHDTALRSIVCVLHDYCVNSVYCVLMVYSTQLKISVYAAILCFSHNSFLRLRTQLYCVLHTAILCFTHSLVLRLRTQLYRVLHTIRYWQLLCIEIKIRRYVSLLYTLSCPCSAAQ